MEADYKACLEQFKLISENVTRNESDYEVERDLNRRIRNKGLYDRLIWFLQAHCLTFKLQSDFNTSNNKFNKLANGKSTETRTNNEIKFIDDVYNRCYIWYYNMMKLYGDYPHYGGCPLRVYILNLINFTCIAVHVIHSNNLTTFSRLLARYTPYVKSNASTSSHHCVQPQDVYYRDLTETYRRIGENETIIINDKNHIPQLEAAFDHLTSSISSIAIIHSGLYGYYNQLQLLVLFGVVMASFLSWTKRLLYVDSISFRFDPVGERRRIICNLNKLISNIAESHLIVLNNMTCGRKEEKFSTKSLKFREQSKSWTCKEKPLVDCCHETRLKILKQSSSICFCSKTYWDNIYFLELISDRNLAKCVRPNNLNAKFYDEQVAQQRSIVIYYSLICLYLSYYLVDNVLFSELEARISNRKLILNCKLFHQNATIVNDTYRMWREEITQQMLDVYNPTNGTSTSANLPLNKWANELFFELYSVMTPNAIKGFFIVIIAGTYVCLWVFFMILFFLDGVSYHNQWLNQLNRQFADSIEMLDIIHQLTELSKKQCEIQQHNHSSIKYPVRASYFNDRNNEHRKQIHRALIITYLNLELFKTSSKTFKRLCTFFLRFLLISAFCNSILCYYWIGSELRRSVSQRITVIWTMNICFTLSLNYYVRLSASLFQHLCKVYRKIDSLLAKMTLNSMQLDPICELWRGQSMKEADIAHIHCVQIYGLEATMSTLIGIDSYAFALSLFFAASSGFI